MEEKNFIAKGGLWIFMLATFFTFVKSGALAQSVHTPMPLGATDSPFGFYEYLPEGYFQAQDPFPLLIFLHGIDEKGDGKDELEKVLTHGPPKLINEGKNFPFVILSPQNMGGFYNPERLREFISFASENYRVDRSRIYLTGISAGAISMWNYLSLYQDQISAAVPIAGNGYKAAVNACKLKNIPIWAFHGEKDTTVKPGGTVGIVDAINKCNPGPRIPARYVIYPRTGHDSWTKTYDRSSGYDIYSWMLKQRKPKGKKVSSSIKKADFKTVNKNLRAVTKLPMALKGNSGLVAADANNIWAINRTSNESYVYRIDTLGKVNDEKFIVNAPNLSWADITKDREGNLYIADVGNPDNHRKTLQIYKIPNPSQTADKRIPAKTIDFSIPDQSQFPPAEPARNFDFESVVHFNDSLFIFSKNRTEPFNGVIKMYVIPATIGSHQAVLADSIFLGDDNPPSYQISSAAISPNQQRLVLLTANKVWLFTKFHTSRFFKGDVTQIILPMFSQKLALDFINDDELYITDLSFRDIQSGKLYKLNVSELME